MRPEIIERYCLDPEQVSVQAVGAAGTADRAGERTQRLEATAIVGRADRADRADRAEERDYDSAERRERTSAALTEDVVDQDVVDQDVVESHRLADTSQALPAREAVVDASRRGVRARRSTATSRRRDIRGDRGG